MDREIITMYLPIFEEKLGRLEAKGLGNSDEAMRLRQAIQWAKSAAPASPEFESKVAA